MSESRYGHAMGGAAGRQLWVVDLVVGLALTAAYVGMAHLPGGDGQPSYDGPAWLAWVVAAGVGLSVALRRRLPVPVLGVVVLALTAATLLDITREPYTAAGLAAYLVGLAEHARRSVATLAVALPVAVGGVYVGEAVRTPSGSPQDAVGVAALVLLMVGGSWAAGRVVRSRRAEALREARRQADRALDEQRLQIARDLHDIVSHNLSLIAVRAGVAAHVADADPHEARSALRAIEETSRAALTEMRRTLGVLRTSDAPLGPAPGLGDLGALADDARRAGVAVHLTVVGAEALPEGDQLTVYRVVQEGLTNAVRYAAPTSCRVSVVVDGEDVLVEVVDEGPEAGAARSEPAPSGGHGLTGIRERARLYGGSVEAGPRPDGGFAVRARLPLDGEVRA
ncbi:sensor histidine kinase [Promicromonospora vindobonensis]|uniref:histidine kinase n=1 Tax=Promicromonospora vindobonensis TaxID=195748 RepID=A0ABW5VX73_9MICO